MLKFKTQITWIEHHNPGHLTGSDDRSPISGSIIRKNVKENQVFVSSKKAKARFLFSLIPNPQPLTPHL